MVSVCSTFFLVELESLSSSALDFDQIIQVLKNVNRHQSLSPESTFF